MNRHHFDTLDDWAHATATRIAEILNTDLAQHGKTSLAVPGGRTASAVLPVLAQMDLDWSRVTVTLADERWVDPAHPDSNERLARTLLPGLSITGLKTDHATPEKGLAEATARIDALSPLGCVLLGMGEDGHIASLFPGLDVQDTTLQTTRRDDHPRISLTPGALMNTHEIVVAVSGAEKCAVIERALEPGPKVELPIRHVLHQDLTPVSVFTA